MNDQLGLFDRRGEDETGDLDLGDLRAALARTAGSPVAEARSTPRRQQRADRLAAARRRRRRRQSTVLALVVLALLAGGVVVGFKVWRNDAATVADFSGSGEAETVVRVQSNDTLTDIAATLATDKVVASAAAFVNAAADNAEVKGIKTGFYRVKVHASAAAALTAITDRGARVGQLRLIPGRQLADVSTRSGGAGKVTDGYITEITRAACVPLNGSSNCFTSADLWRVAETADPVALGVAGWAVPNVLKAPDARKRLEGMLVPGDYNVPPGSTATAALQAVISASASNWNDTDLVAGAKAVKLTPYQLVTVASLVEREGIARDMPKVARVTYNRLAVSMKLQFDSTVNYSLDRAQISTTAAERAQPSPYNTYDAAGLPPTPISSPGPDALDAALNPDDGSWLYFVKIDLKGNSCFSVTLEQHNSCVELARHNHVFGA